MAGNFWQSSHWEQWILDKQDILRMRGEDMKCITEEEYTKLMIFFCNFIHAIGMDSQQPHKTRMQVIATACVYFRRFYARRSLKDIDPFLLAPTSLFLASKVEEHGMMSHNKLIQATNNALKRWPFIQQDLMIRVQHIQEAEFFLLEILDCCLIVYHPYRPLNQLIAEMGREHKDLDAISSYAWKICNDCTRTDLSLMYPPHQIAIACILIASVWTNRDRELKNWFAELAVDFEKHEHFTLPETCTLFSEAEISLNFHYFLLKSPQSSGTTMMQSHSHSGLQVSNMNVHQGVTMGPPPMPQVGTYKVRTYGREEDDEGMSGALSIFPMVEPDQIVTKRRIYKIVLTGGPCGGKTTGQIGWKVYTVPETANILLGGGVKFAELTQEQVFFNQANASTAERILIICDRGAMDPAAYLDKKSWAQILKEINVDQFSLREDRYDQILHMTTAADGAEEYYTLANSNVRSETVEEAIEQDRLTLDAWLGHPRVDVIENVGCKSFDDKILKLIATLCNRMGLPTQDRLAFNSKKRKWLVTSFDEKRMPRCEVFLVRHNYLCTEDQNVQLYFPQASKGPIPYAHNHTRIYCLRKKRSKIANHLIASTSMRSVGSIANWVRLRSRSQRGRTTYAITTRHYDGPEPVETRMQLNYREYMSYIQMEDRSRAPINKERRCFMYGKQYYHLDTYTSPLPPSCKGKPLMLLETYTTAPIGDTNEPLLPDFMTISKEVTSDSTYSMYTIANLDAKIGKRS
ncbi:Cyclin-C [Dirofilaria immitis]|nr:Cyclin-C [Dirofilaria immitis]